MPAPSTVAFALACGVGGAFVDISTDVLDGDPISRRWGRESEFDDTAPGTFQFTLDNGTGKYTPGNTASSLSIPLVEGMKVSWQVDSDIRMGKIRSATPYFVDEFASTGTSRVRILVDDMLGEASRTRLSELWTSAVTGATPYVYYPLDDVAGSLQAAEASGLNALTAKFPDIQGIAFGLPGVFPDTQMSLTARPYAYGGVGTLNSPIFKADLSKQVTYPPNSRGAFGVWFTAPALSSPSASDANVSMRVQVGTGWGFTIQINRPFLPDTMVVSYSTSAGAAQITLPYVPAYDIPLYLSATCTYVFAAGVYTYTLNFYINGVLMGSASQASPDLAPTTITEVKIENTSATGVPVEAVAKFSHLSHTATRVPEELLLNPSESSRIASIASAVPNIVVDTLPAALSPSVIGLSSTEGSSALDALNDVIRTEQGHIYAATTGTLLAPVQKVKIRERTRPTTVSQSFAISEISGAPEFIRDIANMVWAVKVEGSNNSATTYDDTIFPMVGSASTSAKTLLNQGADLQAWGQDRLIRGKNVGLRVASFRIDPRSLSANRWADIHGLVPGDRIRITGLPSTQLGFSTFDAWVLGGAELHGSLTSVYTLHISPTLPATGIYDTDRYMADGALSLSSSINSAVTTMSVASLNVGQVLLSTTETPYVLQIDSEQVNVTAVTGATPQVVTMTRGLNGTTAAAHTAGALIDLATPTYYAF